MADRFFPNKMPDFVLESAAESPFPQEEEAKKESLLKLLSMPYPQLSERFKRAALDLKETVVVKTLEIKVQQVQDYSLYSGSLGTAFLLLKSYQVTGNKEDLHLCSEIIQACNFASLGSRDVTFICGRAGVCALGAVAAKVGGNDRLLDYYLTHFKEIKLPIDLPDELLYGRVGYLWACLFLNKHIGEGTIPSAHTEAIANDVIRNGRLMGNKARCPLMFEWFGKKYWGAAHGLAGIMHVLMDMQLNLDVSEDVNGTLRYMIKNRFNSGNYPTTVKDKEDIRVHWCHGAPGVALTLVKAAEVFGEADYLRAAVDAAKVVWDRGLLKRVGICHGVSGNAYVFLALYRLTGKVEFLYKAKAFACFLLDRAHKLILERQMHGGDAPYSLFEGIGGMAYLFLDMVNPPAARFPAYEL